MKFLVTAMNYYFGKLLDERQVLLNLEEGLHIAFIPNIG